MNKNNFDRKCTVFVMTRDVSLGQCYCTSFFFRKYWEDCPFEFVLCTETKEPNINLFDRVVKVGSGKLWGERLDILLKEENINTPYVLFLLEDFYLKNYVSNKDIYQSIDLLDRIEGGAVRLNPPVFKKMKFDEKYDLQPASSIYRITGQPTIFKTDYLRIFASKHYTPWDFERKGYYLSRELPNKIFCSKNIILDIVPAWTRGMWMPEAYAMMKNAEISPEIYEGKPIYSKKMLIYDSIKMFLIRCFPHLITWLRTHNEKADEKKLKK